jgi:hypothetical protein
VGVEEDAADEVVERELLKTEAEPSVLPARSLSLSESTTPVAPPSYMVARKMLRT